MKLQAMDSIPSRSELFGGTVTVGERGQVVIPAPVRREMGLRTGDRLLVLRAPVASGLLLVGLEHVDEALGLMEAPAQGGSGPTEAGPLVPGERGTVRRDGARL